MNKYYCISIKEIIKSIEARTNKIENDFKINPIVIITFSKFFIEYVNTKIKLDETEWFSPYHPYASSSVFQGLYHNQGFAIIIPPMGASPIATIAEDLIYCGAKTILLACGCWAIAENVQLCDFIIPTHAIGQDGTSLYYNRKPDQETKIDVVIVNLIKNETKKLTNSFQIGKNHSFEAFYKLEIGKILELQKSGYISIENGELNVLSTICKLKNVKFGALFYNYYNPLKGWEIPWLDKTYKECIKLQSEIILKVILKV